MITIDNEFDFGDVVYLKTDVMQLPRIIVGIMILGSGNTLLYKVVSGTEESGHYDFELSTERLYVPGS